MGRRGCCFGGEWWWVQVSRGWWVSWDEAARMGEADRESGANEQSARRAAGITLAGEGQSAEERVWSQGASAGERVVTRSAGDEGAPLVARCGGGVSNV